MSKITTATTGVGTTETTIYTCPTGKETTISRFSITGTKDVTDLKLKYYNSSSSSIIIGFKQILIFIFANKFEFSQFNKDTPIFYKMRHVIDDEVKNVSALDVALENNQIRALNLIIKYIIEF